MERSSLQTPDSLPRRILVVDDESIVRDSIRKVLQFDGHSVEVATCGEEALALLRNSIFDLVITDYDMPRMKGEQLAAAVKTLQPDLPVLLVTAYGEQLRPSGIPLSAVDGILAKPFQLEELRHAIVTLLPKPIGIPATRPTAEALPAVAPRQTR